MVTARWLTKGSWYLTSFCFWSLGYALRSADGRSSFCSLHAAWNPLVESFSLSIMSLQAITWLVSKTSFSSIARCCAGVTRAFFSPVFFASFDTILNAFAKCD